MTRTLFFRCSSRNNVVGTNRLELSTSCMSSKRSDQLGYAPVPIYNTKIAEILQAFLSRCGKFFIFGKNLFAKGALSETETRAVTPAF